MQNLTVTQNTCEICIRSFQNDLCFKDHMKSVHRENQNVVYQLNDKRAKSKILQGAKRLPIVLRK